jgi:chemotaxis regulatin CheY-phosphate phosphatase CheZ
MVPDELNDPLSEDAAEGASTADTGQDAVEPEVLLTNFQHRTEVLDKRLDALQNLIHEIRNELASDAKESLAQLAHAAQDMANGRVYQRIDVEAKGELGALVQSLNQTLQNLQQLDASVKEQTNQVPELAAQLDAITKDTEEATQGVMNRLDTLMAAADKAIRELDGATRAAKAQTEAQNIFQGEIDALLARAESGENPTAVAQEVLEFLFTHRLSTRTDTQDFSEAQAQVRLVNDEAFEILNTLQFQDITRQKIEKVVLLLKKFQNGLQRLLHIFHIEVEAVGADVFEDRHVATQDKIFEAKLSADHSKASVDDIIAQFQKNKQG